VDYQEISKIVSPKAIVIGSGPVGCIASLKLIESGYRVTMIDQILPNNINADVPGLKKSPSGELPYDMNYRYFFHDKSKRNWHPSLGILGFSTVWGGAWSYTDSHYRKESINQLELWLLNDGIGKGRLETHAQSDCSCFTGVDPQDVHPSLTWTTHLNDEVGSPLSMKATLGYLNTLADFDFIDDSISRVEQAEELARAFTSSRYFDADLIAVCAGPVGNACIALNSFSELEKITLSDTNMCYLPILSLVPLKSNRSYRGSTLTFREEGAYTAQIYTHLHDYEKQIAAALPRIFHPIWGAFKTTIINHLSVGLIYIQEELSTSVTISRSESKDTFRMETLKMKRMAIGYFKNLSVVLLKLKLIPLWPLLKITEAGSSYHL
jgi:hypothetical protein